MNKKTIEDVKVSGKRVFVRCDFNVPLDESGNITDDNRIIEALPTINYLLKNKAKVVLCSHLGRPKGAVNSKYSLTPVAKRLNELLKNKVVLALDVVGSDAKEKVAALADGHAVLLENVRFCDGEEKNDSEFSRLLGEFADVFVNDAFGTAHRAHASTAGIAKFCNENVAGYLMKKEVSILGGALSNADRPFVAILGGAKVSDKIDVVKSLLTKVDTLLIGGAMAYTFLAAKGVDVGNSRVERDKISVAADLIKSADEKNVKLLLPIDHAASREFSADAHSRIFSVIPDDYMGLDIGTETCKIYSDIIAKARTVLWNGPMGVFEFDRFAVGTRCVAQAMADNKNAVTIVGGGDSAAAVEQMRFKDKVTHVSTGGGASLEFLEGKELPGVACLDDKIG